MLLLAPAKELIAVKSYWPATTAVAAASTSLVDIDATNLAISFVVPASGKVLAVLSARGETGVNGVLEWGFRDASGDVANSRVIVAYAAGAVGGRANYRVLFTGLTPGAATTWKWAHSKVSGTTANTEYGGSGSGAHGQALMEIWAVDV